MDKAELCPNLMTRFREEHYATRAWKKASTDGTLNQERSAEGDRRTSRALYFQKPLQERKAKYKTAPAWRRLDA